MPNPEPDYAAVVVEGDVSQLAGLASVPTLRQELSVFTDEGRRFRIDGLADAAAQAALVAQGFTVTVTLTPAEYRDRLAAGGFPPEGLV